MIENHFLFKIFEEYNKGVITFSIGKKSTIVEKGYLQVKGILKLDEVVYVERLKANFMSISLICDNDFNVKFTNNICMVTNQNGKCTL